MVEPKKNPWLEIPARDYEGHMGSDGVRQLAFLNAVFRQALEQHQPRSLLILGCATGNGLEHVNPQITKRIVGIDLHKEYLEIAESRLRVLLPDLELRCCDLHECRFEPGSFDLVFGGLFFEYVDPQKAMPMVSEWLTAKGLLVAVLQLPSGNEAKVTKTAYPSLRLLEPIMKLLDPAHFRDVCRSSQLVLHEARTETLASGKSFYIGRYGA
jgi:SAM-dependent methyltransferase